MGVLHVMKFNPITSMLWTDEGKLLKKIHCPIGATQRDLIESANDAICRVCRRSIVSISSMDDEEVDALFAKSPDQCVRFSLNDPNMRMTLDVSTT